MVLKDMVIPSKHVKLLVQLINNLLYNMVLGVLVRIVNLMQHNMVHLHVVQQVVVGVIISGKILVPIII